MLVSRGGRTIYDRLLLSSLCANQWYKATTLMLTTLHYSWYTVRQIYFRPGYLFDVIHCPTVPINMINARKLKIWIRMDLYKSYSSCQAAHNIPHINLTSDKYLGDTHHPPCN